MKKKYMIPQTETVNVRLISSVLDGIDFGRASQGIGGDDEWNDAKENDGFFDMDDNFGDIWDENEPKDPWKE